MANDIYVYEYEYKLSCHRFSVVVFGKEYAYGSNGVKIRDQVIMGLKLGLNIGNNLIVYLLQGKYKNSVPEKKTYKGENTRTKKAFEDFLKRPEFDGSNYNVANNNCLTFVNAALKFLMDKNTSSDLHNGSVSSNPIAVVVNYIAGWLNLNCA